MIHTSPAVHTMCNWPKSRTCTASNVISEWPNLRHLSLTWACLVIHQLHTLSTKLLPNWVVI